MAKPTLPSEFLPDFLRMDLNVGTSLTHPLVKALDAAFGGWEFSLLQRAHSLQPNYYSLARQKEVLSHLGFQLQGLSDSQISDFFQSLHQCLDNPGTLQALSELARVHFGECGVSRGLPYQRQQLSSAQSFPLRLHDAEASKTILFVRLTHEASPELINAFTHNAGMLIPAGFQVLVSPPTVEIPVAETRMSLKSPIPLKARKL